MTCQTLAPTMNKITSTSLPIPDPKKDGIDHINVHYNDGITSLGRQLSSYYVQAFKHPYFGPFRCVAGFMCYVRTGCRDDAFRGMTGSQATAYLRQQIKEKKLSTYDIEDEENVLMLAMHARLTQHSVTATLFKNSTLPFENYFLWSDDKTVARKDRLPARPADSAMVIQSLTTLREYMQAGLEPDPINRDAYAKLRKT